MRSAKGLFRHLAGDPLVAKVDEHEVVVRAAANQVVATIDKRCRHGLGILDHLLHVRFVTGLKCLAEGHRLGSDDVFERSALHSRKYAAVEQGTHLAHYTFRRGLTPRVVKVLAHHDDATAGAAQRFVRRGCHDVAMRHGVVEEASGDETGWVADVREEQCTYAVGNLPEPGVIPVAAVRRCSTNNELGLNLSCRSSHLIHVDGSGFLLHAVEMRLVQLARVVHRGAVRQVTAVAQIETKDGIAGVEHREHDSRIGRSTGVRLDIGPCSTKQFAQSINRQLLDFVHHFATAVVTASGQPLGVLISEHTALRFHDLVAGVVFTGNELNALHLTMVFTGNEVGNLLVAHGIDVKGAESGWLCEKSR